MVWALYVVVSFESASDTSSTVACAGFGPPYSGSGRWVCFTGQPRTVQEYKGQGSKVPLYLGFRPADGLSVELEGWTPAYRIDSVGCALTRYMPPWRSERADVIISAPLQGRLILSIAVSPVTGRFMLKPDPITTNYILYLLVPSFSSSRGCRGRELGGMINVYNLLLYIVAATSASLLLLLLY